MQSASALEYLHSANVVHRDIAARNFLLSSPFKVYLSDFGMSRLITSTDATQKTANNVGPIRWMAPESIFRMEYSKKSDVYMFANFVYEVLYRRVPFADVPNLLDVGDAVQAGQRPSLSRDCPPALLPLFESCWATDPAERMDMGKVLEVVSTLPFEISSIPDAPSDAFTNSSSANNYISL